MVTLCRIFAFFVIICALVTPATISAQERRSAWSGLYWGAQVGGGWTHLDAKYSDEYENSTNTQLFQDSIAIISNSWRYGTSTRAGGKGTGSGFVGEMLLGYGIDIGSAIVAGIQVEAGTANAQLYARGSGTGASTHTFLPPSTTTSDFVTSKRLNYTASVLGRIGYEASSDILVYGSAGYTLGGLGDDGTVPGQSARVNGITFGAGVEGKVTNNWSLRLEYRFTDFFETTIATSTSARSSQSYTNEAGTTVSTTTEAFMSREKLDASLHTVRLGIVYQFGKGRD